ncbi:hypothetical protein BDN70DRAFT_572491 [Pholiota conissans]|uniref:Helicase C-terminal domain-containing protein n=1 Tax=Pholiota conissans TaxID=109636 RepID=A0A9P5Z4L6_9AGAR|nr:hypothetical protein BDN70DRAFT_572491 [Pholiota conissans]
MDNSIGEEAAQYDGDRGCVRWVFSSIIDCHCVPKINGCFVLSDRQSSYRRPLSIQCRRRLPISPLSHGMNKRPFVRHYRQEAGTETIFGSLRELGLASSAKALSKGMSPIVSQPKRGGRLTVRKFKRQLQLHNVRFTSIKAKLGLSKVNENRFTGDLDSASLAAVMNSKAMNRLVVQSWRDRAAECKSTVVFCASKDHAERLTLVFRGHDIDARYITADMPELKRQELIQSFKEGVFPVLVDYDTLTEDDDMPNIDCVFIARPTCSLNVFGQMVNHGLKPSPGTGKTDCRIIDFIDVRVRESGAISIPKLLGLDPREFDVDDETMESLEQRKTKEEVKLALERIYLVSDPNHSVSGVTLTYTDHEDASESDPIQNVAPDGAGRHAFSRFSWVCCGENVWMLELLEEGNIIIEAMEAGQSAGADPADLQSDTIRADSDLETLTEPLFKASLMPRSRHRDAELVLHNMSFKDIVRACDDLAVKMVSSTFPPTTLYHNAPWRKERASKPQIDIIKKLGQSNTTLGRKLKDFSKGQASTLIARLKYDERKKKEQKSLKAIKSLKLH